LILEALRHLYSEIGSIKKLLSTESGSERAGGPLRDAEALKRVAALEAENASLKHIAVLVGRGSATSPEDLERNLAQDAEAGTLGDLEQERAGRLSLSRFDEDLLRLLRRIPVESLRRLEREIALLIPKNERATAVARERERLRAAIAREKERFASENNRLQDAYLVALARQIPAQTPGELEVKIATRIARKPRFWAGQPYLARLARVLFKSRRGA
jgi:hypothetical protein